jgi:hypothetical protein
MRKKLATVRHLVASLGTAALIAGGLVVGTGTAEAATCSGSGCTGLDPVKTECNQNAYIVLQETAWGGTANLWWSPECQSNWIQYDAPDSGELYDLGLTGSTGYGDTTYVIRTAGWSWGNLVYSPGAAQMCIGETYSPDLPFKFECWTQSS